MTDTRKAALYLLAAVGGLWLFDKWVMQPGSHESETSPTVAVTVPDNDGTCADGKLNGEETDRVDAKTECGGNSHNYALYGENDLGRSWGHHCAPCPTGKRCRTYDDCESGHCNKKTGQAFGLCDAPYGNPAESLKSPPP